MPVIQTSLDEVNAREYWRSVINAYNKIPFTKKVNPELDEYVTQKALDGMYSLIEKKELDIRKNQSSRTSDLLAKVFAKQD
jgi:glutaredoxin 2